MWFLTPDWTQTERTWNCPFPVPDHRKCRWRMAPAAVLWCTPCSGHGLTLHCGLQPRTEHGRERKAYFFWRMWALLTGSFGSGTTWWLYQKLCCGLRLFHLISFSPDLFLQLVLHGDLPQFSPHPPQTCVLNKSPADLTPSCWVFPEEPKQTDAGGIKRMPRDEACSRCLRTPAASEGDEEDSLGQGPELWPVRVPMISDTLVWLSGEAVMIIVLSVVIPGCRHAVWWYFRLVVFLKLLFHLLSLHLTNKHSAIKNSISNLEYCVWVSVLTSILFWQIEELRSNVERPQLSISEGTLFSSETLSNLFSPD